MALLDQIRDAVKGALADTSATRIKELGDQLAAALAAHETTKTLLATATSKINELETAAALVPATDARVTALESKKATLTAQVAQLSTQNTALANEVATLEATIADPKGKIEQVAGTKAAEIAAAQGVLPIPAAPAANPKAEKTETPGLKGRARFAAATKAQLDKDFPLNNRN